MPRTSPARTLTTVNWTGRGPAARVAGLGPRDRPPSVPNAPGASATEMELEQLARDNIAHFKTPPWFTFVDDLPKTATGKIQN